MYTPEMFLIVFGIGYAPSWLLSAAVAFVSIPEWVMWVADISLLQLGYLIVVFVTSVDLGAPVTSDSA